VDVVSEQLVVGLGSRGEVGTGRRPVPDGLVQRVQRRLALERATPDPVSLARAVRAESAGVIDEAQMLVLIRQLEQELAGCGPLTALLADDATTDVVVNGPDDVRVDRGGGWEQSGVAFADEAAVQRLARRLAGVAGQRLDDAHPFVDGRLPDGTRLHAVLPPIASTGTCLSLRVLRPARYDLDSLCRAGLLPGVTAPVVRAALWARLAFVVSGGTGSGKTTLLGALLGQVDPAERIVTVEDAEELHPAHPHLVRLVARPANVEGAGAVGMRELVRQALRMRPDRLVVGEVRGAEVIDLVGALTTGHEGGAGTVHANSAGEVPTRLAALAAQGGMDPTALHAQLAGAVQMVLHLRRDAGRRRLAEVAVLTGSAQVMAVPAVVDGALVPDGAPLLDRMLQARGVAAPWR
jgi:pilus assembly protein CpaF